MSAFIRKEVIQPYLSHELSYWHATYGNKPDQWYHGKTATVDNICMHDHGHECHCPKPLASPIGCAALHVGKVVKVLPESQYWIQVPQGSSRRGGLVVRIHGMQ